MKKNRINRNGYVDTISLHDLIKEHQLKDFENILSLSQGLSDAIVLLAQRYDIEKTGYAISAIAQTLNLLQDINRINWEEYEED